MIWSFIRGWEESADKTVYFRLDHTYYDYGGGFELSNDCDPITSYLGAGLCHITHRLGLTYLNENVLMIYSMIMVGSLIKPAPSGFALAYAGVFYA